MADIHNKRSLLGRRRLLRMYQTRAEWTLWQELRGKKLGVRFRRQHAIGNYIVDFYCAAARMVVEVDGSTHGSPKEQAYDRVRELDLCAIGHRVLRFSNEEVLECLDDVMDVIRTELQHHLP